MTFPAVGRAASHAPLPSCPASCELVSTTPTETGHNCSVSGAGGTQLQTGSTWTYAITVTGTTPGNYTSIIEVKFSPDNNPQNNIATCNTEILNVPDVVLEKAPARGIALIGSTFTYSLTVSNRGHADALDVTTTETLPEGLTFLSSTGGRVLPAFHL